MKINNNIMALSLVITTSLITGCVQDTMFDEKTPVSRHATNFKTIFSTITELEVVLSQDIAVEEFDKQIIEVLGSKKNLSSNELGDLFSTLGKTTVTSNSSIMSSDGKSFDYLPQQAGYLSTKYKVVEGEKEYNLDRNGYYSSLMIKSVPDNKFEIKSMITKLTSLEKRKFVYEGFVNQYEAYPIYVSKEDNNTYKMTLIQIHKVPDKK